jgi:Na+-driven multidrug efflux pump
LGRGQLAVFPSGGRRTRSSRIDSDCSSLTDVLQLAKFGFFGAFAGKVLEEAVKAAFFFFRFCSTRWYAHGLKEAGEKLKKE